MSDKVRRTAKSVQTKPPLEAGGGFWRNWWPCLLVAAVVAWVFLPCLNNDFVTYDDPEYVTRNERVRAGLSLGTIAWAFSPTTNVCANWHPLTLLSHALDCEWHSLNPYGHHLTSLLLHVANSVLVFVVLKRMTGSSWSSFAVAVLFGLHPAHVESVAWVAERKDVLSGFFWMLSIWAYVEFVKGQAANAPRTRTYYFLALAAFALGLLAKPMLVTLPFVLLLLDYWPLQRLTLATIRRLVLEKVPFFILTLISCVVTLIAQKQGGATTMAEAVPFFDRLTNALVSYCRYVGMLFWPKDLAAFYPFRENWPVTVVVLSALAVAGSSLAVVLLGRKRGYFPTGWFWFLGTLVPVIGLVQVGAQSIADRYTYLPSIGFFVVVAWGADELLRQWRAPGWSIGALGVAAGVACIGATRNQIAFWKDGETLFRRAVAISGEHYLPRLGLGGALLIKRQFHESIAELQRARELRPSEVFIHFNLCTALLAEDRIEEALAVCWEGTRVQPKAAMAWSNLGRCQMKAGEMANAVESLQRAVAIEPKDPSNHHMLGVALRAEKRFEEAIHPLRRALELQPGLTTAREELVKALLLEGQLEEARSEWRQATGIAAGSAVEHNSFGVLLAELGQMDSAIKEFEAAQRIEPGNADAKNNLARAHAAKAKEARPVNDASNPPAR